MIEINPIFFLFGGMIFICNMCMHIVGNFGSPPLFHGVIGKERRVCDSSHTLGWHGRWYCIESNWRFVSSSSSIPPLYCCFFFPLSPREQFVLAGWESDDIRVPLFGKPIGFTVSQMIQGRVMLR